MKTCHLRAIGYQSDPPLVQFSNHCWKPDCPKAGNAVDYLNVVMNLMNCSWEVVHLDVNSEDTFDMILNGTADMTVLPLRQTLERMQKAYFTTPVSYLYYGYLVREIPQLEVADYILSSFDPEVLLLLIACGIFVGILIYLFILILRRQNKNIFEWIFISSRGLIGQFYCKLDGPVAAHILVGFWLFFCLIIIHNFQAKLKSFLTLSRSKGTMFTTMNEMIDAVLYDGWTLVLQDRGFSPMNYCSKDQCDRLRQIPNNKIYRVKTDEGLVDAVTNPKFVGFIGYTYDIVKHPLTYMNIKKKVIFVRDTEAVPEFLAYAVSKNVSGLRNAFNEAVAISYPAFEITRGRYTGEMTEYVATSSTFVKGEITVLSTQHLMILYKVTGILLLLGIILLSAEFFYFRFGAIIILKIKHTVPGRFTRVFHITHHRHGFQRPNTIILPPRRTPSPVNNLFAKYYTI